MINNNAMEAIDSLFVDILETRLHPEGYGWLCEQGAALRETARPGQLSRIFAQVPRFAIKADPELAAQQLAQSGKQLPVNAMREWSTDTLSRVWLLLQVPEGLPPVLCDRTMVEQVLLNLARNAMQAMDGPLESKVSERTLTMRVEPAPASAAADGSRPRGWLLFSVADVGAGIDPLVAERVFTPFFSTRADGMGLGLSMCRTVIEQHGGFLEFGPNLPRGTVFRFTLPTDVASASPAAATIATIPA